MKVCVCRGGGLSGDGRSLVPGSSGPLCTLCLHVIIFYLQSSSNLFWSSGEISDTVVKNFF